MPRVKDYKCHKYDKLIMTITGMAKLQEKNVKDMAKMAGCSTSTLYCRFKKPQDFTISELTGIGRGLGIPIEEFRQTIMY